jgi:hypothetical protein
LEIRVVGRVSPVLKKLKGYHNESAIPEYMMRDDRLSRRLILIKLPKAI